MGRVGSDQDRHPKRRLLDQRRRRRGGGLLLAPGRGAGQMGGDAGRRARPRRRGRPRRLHGDLRRAEPTPRRAAGEAPAGAQVDRCHRAQPESRAGARLRPALLGAEVGLAGLGGRRAGGEIGGPARPRERGRRGPRLPGAERLLGAARRGRRPPRARRRLRRHGLPAPLLARRRPGPPHPHADLQYDPRRGGRQVAEPRRAEGADAALAAGEGGGLPLPGRAAGRGHPRAGAGVGRGPKRLRRPRRLRP